MSILLAIFRVGNACYIVGYIVLACALFSDHWVLYPPEGNAGLWSECMANRTSSMSSNSSRTPRTSTTTTMTSTEEEEEEDRCKYMDISKIPGFLHCCRALTIMAALVSGLPVITCRVLRYEEITSQKKFFPLVCIGIGGIISLITRQVYQSDAQDRYGPESSLDVGHRLITTFMCMAFISVLLMLAPFLARKLEGTSFKDLIQRPFVACRSQCEGCNASESCINILCCPCQRLCGHTCASTHSPTGNSFPRPPRRVSLTTLSVLQLSQRARAARQTAPVEDSDTTSGMESPPHRGAHSSSTSGPAPRYDSLPPPPAGFFDASPSISPPTYEEVLRDGYELTVFHTGNHEPSEGSTHNVSNEGPSTHNVSNEAPSAHTVTNEAPSTYNVSNEAPPLSTPSHPATAPPPTYEEVANRASIRCSSDHEAPPPYDESVV